LNKLDEKIINTFNNESVFKTKERYSVFSGINIPSFIKDWLVKKYTDDNGKLDVETLLSFIQIHIATGKNDIKSRIRTHREEVKILTRFIVENDIKNDILKFSIPDLGIKSSEGKIPNHIAKRYKELKDGEVWGVITLVYIPPMGKEKGIIELIDFKPFKPYQVDLEYFQNARKEYNTEEWIDLLIRSMEYNPGYNDPVKGFNSLEKKLLFISRLLIFVEPNMNLIELAPKGTGKSYVFSNLSKYGWMFSGGIVSRAKLFYDVGRRIPGIIENYDFVSLDEIETIKFSDENELQGALKSYLEAGKFSIANYSGVSTAGMMLLGNIKLSSNLRPINRNYFETLPKFFQHSALLDRFHGFIEGWNLVRINEDIIVKGYSLNVEYFSEILHTLRHTPHYSHIVSELISVPKGSDTRDTKAIIRLATAYMKLIFPNVSTVKDIDKRDFEIYCLNPALEKRRIIRQQINLIDPEFSPYLPNITIK